MAKNKNPKKAKAKKAPKKAVKKPAKKAVKSAGKAKPAKKKAIKKTRTKPVQKKKAPAKKKSVKAKVSKTKAKVAKVAKAGPKKVAKKASIVKKPSGGAKKNVVKKSGQKGGKPPLPKMIFDTKPDQTNVPFAAHRTHLRPGTTAPYFEAKDQHGNTVNLYSLNGKTVILYFYPKDDTPGCTKEACSLRDEYKFLSDNNYAVIGVSADDAASHRKFAAKYELPFPLLADTDMSIIKAYDVWGQKMLAGRIYDGIVRTTFIIDGYGIIQNVIHEVNTENHAQQILAL